MANSANIYLGTGQGDSCNVPTKSPIQGLLNFKFEYL
jgi:hypothetical protein